MKTAFFGGSFDPPHTGHLAVAKGALESGMCTHILWAVAFDPPHKTGFKRAPFADRMEMVRLLIAGEKAMSTSDIEAKLGIHPTYTIEILRHYESLFNERPALLIGADSLAALHLWHKGKILAAEYDILTYPRKGADISIEVLAENFHDKKIAEKLFAGVIPGKFFEISSTSLRNSMEKSTFTCNIKEMTFLTPEIERYIAEKDLYRQ